MVHFEDLLLSFKGGFKTVISTYQVVYSILGIVPLYLTISNGRLLLGDYGRGIDLLLFAGFLLITSISLLSGAIFCHLLTARYHIMWNLLGLTFGVSLFFQLTDIAGIIFYTLLGGFSLGFCIPCIINSLVKLTTFENRGSVSGISIMLLFLVIGVGLVLVNSMIEIALVVIITKALSLLTILKMKPFKDRGNNEEFTNVRTWIKLVFIFSWSIFLLVDAVTNSILSQFSSMAPLLRQSIFVGLASMVIGGILLDHVGRKKLILFSYAFIGMVFSMVTISGGDLLPMTFFDGIPWGVLTVFFVMVLWGDICSAVERPFYIAASLVIVLLEILLVDYLRTIGLGLSIANVFPIASIFLFIAAFVILILPETLPEKVIQNRELKEYIRSAKKIKEKFGKG